MSDFDEGMDEILKEFPIESHENIEQFSLDLIALKENPPDADRLGTIFRCLHTLKGTCGFFGFEKLESISHVAENLLSRLRDGELVLNTEMTSALLSVVDAVREILSYIHDTNTEGDGDYTDLVASTTKNEESDTAPLDDADEERVRQLGQILVSEHDVEPTNVAGGLLKQLEGNERPLGEILVEDEGWKPRRSPTR